VRCVVAAPPSHYSHSAVRSSHMRPFIIRYADPVCKPHGLWHGRLPSDGARLFSPCPHMSHLTERSPIHTWEAPRPISLRDLHASTRRRQPHASALVVQYRAIPAVSTAMAPAYTRAPSGITTRGHGSATHCPPRHGPRREDGRRAHLVAVENGLERIARHSSACAVQA
jgi:hypothetical protein